MLCMIEGAGSTRMWAADHLQQPSRKTDIPRPPKRTPVPARQTVSSCLAKPVSQRPCKTALAESVAMSA